MARFCTANWPARARCSQPSRLPDNGCSPRTFIHCRYIPLRPNGISLHSTERKARWTSAYPGTLPKGNIKNVSSGEAMGSHTRSFRLYVALTRENDPSTKRPVQRGLVRCAAWYDALRLGTMLWLRTLVANDCASGVGSQGQCWPNLWLAHTRVTQKMCQRCEDEISLSTPRAEAGWKNMILKSRPVGWVWLLLFDGITYWSLRPLEVFDFG